MQKIKVNKTLDVKDYNCIGDVERKLIVNLPYKKDNKNKIRSKQ